MAERRQGGEGGPRPQAADGARGWITAGTQAGGHQQAALAIPVPEREPRHSPMVYTGEGRAANSTAIIRGILAR